MPTPETPLDEPLSDQPAVAQAVQGLYTEIRKGFRARKLNAQPADLMALVKCGEAFLLQA